MSVYEKMMMLECYIVYVFYALRCKRWALNPKRQELHPSIISMDRLSKVHHLCSAPFEDSQFMNPHMKNQVIHNAVPTIFSIPNPPQTVTLKRKIPDYHPASQHHKKSSLDINLDEKIKQQEHTSPNKAVQDETIRPQDTPEKKA